MRPSGISWPPDNIQILMSSGSTFRIKAFTIKKIDERKSNHVM
jgi:hypothetical protein